MAELQVQFFYRLQSEKQILIRRWCVFKIRAVGTLGLVGESGCGKTTVGSAIARLYKPIAENVIFDGTDLSHLCYGAPAEVRQNLQIIFQNPFDSLNARHTVRVILKEPFEIHHVAPRSRKNR